MSIDSQDPKNFWITGAFQRDYSGNSEDITVKLRKTNGILGFNVSVSFQHYVYKGIAIIKILLGRKLSNVAFSKSGGNYNIQSL